MAAWGELSARSAHMIGNRVFAIKGHLNELEHQLASPHRPVEHSQELARQIRQGVYRLEEILQEFRDFVLATQLKKSEVSLADLLREVVAEAPQAGLGIRLELAPDLPCVSGDPSRLRRAFAELIENAAHHQEEGGELILAAGPLTPATRARVQSAEGSGERSPLSTAQLPDPGVAIEFIDRGPGIPVENKARLFDPFFTTRAKGMGLGLSIVKGIIDAHGGSIHEVGRPGEGAHFVIVLPL
jgi:signal transduction histidine kinase